MDTRLNLFGLFKVSLKFFTEGAPPAEKRDPCRVRRSAVSVPLECCQVMRASRLMCWVRHRRNLELRHRAKRPPPGFEFFRSRHKAMKSKLYCIFF